MEVRVTQDGLKMGDGEVIKALQSKNIGIRLSFLNAEATSRCDFILNSDEAKKLIESMQVALNSAEEFKMKGE